MTRAPFATTLENYFARRDPVFQHSAVFRTEVVGDALEFHLEPHLLDFALVLFRHSHLLRTLRVQVSVELVD